MAGFMMWHRVLVTVISLWLISGVHAWAPANTKGGKLFNWKSKKAFSQRQPAAAMEEQEDGVTTFVLEQQDRSKEIFPQSQPPYLAIVTQRHSCDSEDELKASLMKLYSIVSTGLVDLVSVRVNCMSTVKDHDRRVLELTRRLVKWSDVHSFRVVVSSDWVDVAVEARAHGVHVCESQRHKIPAIRSLMGCNTLIGTTAHTLESAQSAFDVYRPDYMFVGSCYFSNSHPEKISMEGPRLPGKVFQAMKAVAGAKHPRVLAIGGVDETNCHELVCNHGAEGVAVIRAVFEAEDPAATVRSIRQNMSDVKP